MSVNLVEIFSDIETLADCACSIVKEATNNGFIGFAGNCGQAAILINECLFNDTQQIFTTFNKALKEKDCFVGHVACRVNLEQQHLGEQFSFLLDSDAKVKTPEYISGWGQP